MSLTNPNKLVNVQELAYFEGKIGNKYAQKAAVSGKADKVSGATGDDLAALNSNGNLKDSGIAIKDIQEMEAVMGLDTDYEFVDLGLPSGTLWAKCNIGAASETDYGNYYMYGKGSTQYNKAHARYTGREVPLKSTADTASVVMGDSWHMPTYEQVKELNANTTATWETNYKNTGINGCKFTASNGNYIFIPAAGNYNALGNLDKVGTTAHFWTSTPDSSVNTKAYRAAVNSENPSINYGTEDRVYGYSIRGVITAAKGVDGYKADKVSNATENNFPALTPNGNLKDSGKKASDFAAASHTHGNVASDGTLQTTDADIASGDKLVITDASDSDKVVRSSAAFDGATANKALTQKGTFERFATKDEYDTLAARVAVTVLGEKAVFAADYNVSVSGTKVIFG